MSISDEIKGRIGLLVDEERLFCLSPMLGGEQVVRTIFVSQEVNDCIHGPFEDNFDDMRFAEFRSVLDSFILGWLFTVAEKPYNKPGYTMLARVDPVGAEVWDIRCVAAGHGIRCFGSFAGKDTFIALTWNYRENLCSAVDWKYAIAECKTTWAGLFGTLKPFKGKNLDEYLTENYRTV